MKFKIYSVAAMALFIVILCACSGRPAALPASSEIPEHTNTAVFPQTASSIDVIYLLSCIAQSNKRLECFPALIKGAQIDNNGCMLHIDRLEINPDYGGAQSFIQGT